MDTSDPRADMWVCDTLRVPLMRKLIGGVLKLLKNIIFN